MIYAIVKNGTVTNVVEAENTLPFHVIFPEADEFVQFTTESGAPAIGKRCTGGKFQPYNSWTFDESLGEWVAPEPKPEGESYWDESQLSWVIVEPEPEA